MGLLDVITEYDREMSDHVDYLVAENQRLQSRVNELTSLLMKSTQANDRKMLDLILTGHFDKPRTEASPE